MHVFTSPVRDLSRARVIDFFTHFFSSSLSLHRHLSESFSLGINPGWERRAERLQCSCRPVHPELVLFVSDCCFCRLIDKCKFVFKHIFSSFLQLWFFVTYTVCGNFEAWIFFLRIFLCMEFSGIWLVYKKKIPVFVIGLCRQQTNIDLVQQAILPAVSLQVSLTIRKISIWRIVADRPSRIVAANLDEIFIFSLTAKLA